MSAETNGVRWTEMLLVPSRAHARDTGKRGIPLTWRKVFTRRRQPDFLVSMTLKAPFDGVRIHESVGN
jgi:hypothetical protein